MQKINEVSIGKNQQIIGLKSLIFRLHCMTIYSQILIFLTKKLVTTQAFAFSRFKNQTPILSLWQEKIYFNNVYSTGALSQLISKIAKALINSL